METVVITEEVMTFDESKELLGEWPVEGHIRQWFDPQVDTRFVFKTVFGETILAGVKKNVYQGQIYDEIKECLLSIDDTTTMRANCAGPIDLDKLKQEGVNATLRTKNSYYVIDENGKTSTIAQGNPIHSVMMGYKRGRFTGKIDRSGWSKENPDKDKILSQIPNINDEAYKELAPGEFECQKTFVESSIQPEYRIGGGIHTTLAANKYSPDGSPKMSYHIDSGDLEGGLTTIATFLEGEVKTYFVLPRFGIAISRGDGDVFVGDSGQVHGVIDIKGNGISMNVVSYCDTRLATMSSRGKPEKLIGQAAKKQISTLDGFGVEAVSKGRHGMRVTKQTIDILKNFSLINPSILVEKGSELKTMSVMKTIYARSGVRERFDRRFGIYDLPRLLRLMTSNPMKDTELELGGEYLTLANDKTSLRYFYADEKTIVFPTKTLEMPPVEIEFSLYETDLDSILSITRMLSTKSTPDMDLLITSDGQTIYTTVLDKRNPTSDSCRLSVGEGNGDTYSIYFKIDSIGKLLKGSYDVSISTKGISHFSNQDIDLEYWIANEHSTEDSPVMFNGEIISGD